MYAYSPHYDVVDDVAVDVGQAAVGAIVVVGLVDGVGGGRRILVFLVVAEEAGEPASLRRRGFLVLRGMPGRRSSI